MRLLAYDEHRLGLRPVYRRVWARRGERPLAVGAHRYRWFYVCTFVEPETGESLSLLVDGMDTEVMSWVLRELRAWLGEGEEAWVVLDRAGWHVLAFTLTLLGTLAGRPPALGAGIRGSRAPHSPSFRSLGYALKYGPLLRQPPLPRPGPARKPR